MNMGSLPSGLENCRGIFDDLHQFYDTGADRRAFNACETAGVGSLDVATGSSIWAMIVSIASSAIPFSMWRNESDRPE